MDLARFVVDAVVLEGRSYRDVAASHGVSKSWVGNRVARYRAGGYEAVAPRSKAAKKVANRSSAELEDKVESIRKELTVEGPCRGMIEVMRVIRERDGEEFATGLQAAREAVSLGDLDAVAYVLGVRVEEIQLISGSLHHSRPAPSL